MSGYEESVIRKKVSANRITCEEAGGIYVPAHMRKGVHINSYCKGVGKDFFLGMYEEDPRYPRLRDRRR